MTQIPPTAALPMPADGWRRLSPQEVQRRAQAMACLRDNTPQCQGQVHVNLFFDGTGNNWDWEGVFVTGKRRSTQTQLARNGHSNITRLWRVSPYELENGLFSFYIPGVGTPFPEIRDSGDGFLDGTLGAAAARYGVNRINWGIIQTYNALHQYVRGSDLVKGEDVRKLVYKMSSVNSMAGERVLRNQWVYEIRARLEGALQSAQRKVTSIHIAVFGFSRGSAQARAFVHWLFDSAQHWNTGNGPNLAGVPMRLTFLGIFDTVASVGVAGISRVFEGHFAWAGGELMNIHPGVEKCVHFVALHEQRINFPVDLADRGKQVLYPGMHSDVGGGYTPGSQGKDFVDGKPQGGAKLSQIPLIDMYHEAVKAEWHLLNAAGDEVSTLRA